MTKPITLSVQIPFPGFYGSEYEDGLDAEAASWVEWAATDGEEEDSSEKRHPPELRLDADELAGLMFAVSDFTVMRHIVADEYVAAFAHGYRAAFGYDLSPVFEEVVSPRFYNYDTDRIFAKIPLKVLRDMLRDHKADGYKTLLAVIEGRHTSRDGFASFYKVDLSVWLSRPLTDWDCNELSTLLRAAAVLKGRERYGPDHADGVEGVEFFYDVRGRVAEHGGFYRAWEQGVDWEALEAARDAAREAKRQDALKGRDLNDRL